EQGDYAASQASYEQGLSIARNTGNDRAIATALHNLAHLALVQGDYTMARARTEESMVLRERINDARNPLDLLILAEVALAQGDYASARMLGEECLAIRRKEDSTARIAEILITLGKGAEYECDYRRAFRYYTESLMIFQEIGTNLFFVILLRRFASVAVAQYQPERAAWLWGAEEALREAIHSILPPAEREEYSRLMTATREALGDEAFTAAWEQGRAMGMEQAIEYALEANG
ncbi:MAG TPA: tetratricopeptide repeat protein, partial [Chthonomonadaceae bacterium]|nr:tetratricopeptide repeat protein [Chthonomonadaceae bacterium]